MKTKSIWFLAGALLTGLVMLVIGAGAPYIVEPGSTPTGALTNNAGVRGWYPNFMDLSLNIWTNDLNNGQTTDSNVIHTVNISDFTELYLGGSPTHFGTNNVVYGQSYDPPNGDFFILQENYDDAFGMNVPAVILATLDRRTAAIADPVTYGFLLVNKLTNTAPSGYFYANSANGSYGSFSQVINHSGDANSSSSAIGAGGEAGQKGWVNTGVAGLAVAVLNAQTNVGGAFVGDQAGKTGGATVGLYAETAANLATDPVMQNSVALLDNRTLSTVPILTARSNSVTQFQLDGNGRVNIFLMTNQIVFGATNTAPSGTATPTKWLSVQIQGESVAYRIGLFQ